MLEKVKHEAINRISEAIDRYEDLRPLHLKMLEDELGDRSVIIYGAGLVGRRFADWLTGGNRRVVAFIDRNAACINSYRGIPIFSLTEFFNSEVKIEHAVTVVALYGAVQRKSQRVILLEKGFTSLGDAWDSRVFNLFVRSEEDFPTSQNYVKGNKRKVLELVECLSDIESVRIYERYLLGVYAFAEGGTLFPLSDGTQYFPEDIQFKKGYTCFVDAGAFTGDTLSDLYRIKASQNEEDSYTAISFEPDFESYQTLLSNVKEYEGTNLSVFTYNLGLYNREEVLRFAGTSSGSSHIANGGNYEISCCSLDWILGGRCPTFIKMDVERAELKALQGSKQTIQRCRPDLAISVYHQYRDLWEIPSWLKMEAGGTYSKFYLRQYATDGIDLVLYAVAD